MDLDGNVHHVNTHDILECPYGVAVDREDNIYIAGYESDGIHIISPQCTTIRVLQDGKPRMNGPYVVTYMVKEITDFML